MALEEADSKRKLACLRTEAEDPEKEDLEVVMPTPHVQQENDESIDDQVID